MYNNNNYYEPEDDQDAIAYEEAEHEAWKLVQVGGKFDFRTTQAIMEMMGELDVEQDKALQAIIDEGDHAKIGLKILCMAEDYMMGHAMGYLGFGHD